MMTRNDVFFHCPEIVSDFSVIFCFRRLRPLQVSLKFFPEIFTHHRLIPSNSRFSDFMISSNDFAPPSAIGIFFYTLCDVNTSCALSLRVWIAVTHERRSQLTYLFNVMTSHMSPCIRFSVSFSSMLKGDKMTNRHAELITESVIVKQRSVRNLCAYDPHSTSSSSSTNPQANRAVITSEQEDYSLRMSTKLCRRAVRDL